jgi:hypothetical protein
LLERDERARLASVLTPEQLEEYLLRHSLTAQRLRNQLKELNVGRGIPEPLQGDGRSRGEAALVDANDPVARKRLAELEVRSRPHSNRAGTAPVCGYGLRRTRSSARRGPPRNGRRARRTRHPLYQVNQAALEERRRVLADDSAAPDEQTRRLTELYEQRLVALRALVGKTPSSGCRRSNNREPFNRSTV